MTTEKEINEQIQRLTEKRTDIVARCKKEGRTWTSEEMQESVRMEQEQGELREKAKLASEFEKQVAIVNSGSTESRGRTVETERELTPDEYSEAFRTWASCAKKANIAKCNEKQTALACRSGYDLHLDELELLLPKRSLRAIEQRAQQVATGAAGLFTVPDEMMGSLDLALKAYGGMFDACTLLRTQTGADLPIPTANDTNNTFGALVAESGTLAEQDVTFAQTVLKAYKYTSKIVRCSVEFLQDTYLNPEQFLGNALGMRISRAVHVHLTTGTGSAQPNGLMTAATDSTVALGADNAPTFANLVAIQHKVDPLYRAQPKCAWMFNDTVLQNVRSLVDTQGRPLWLDNLVGNSPNLLLGKPVFINQDISSSGTLGTRVIAFGDMSKYIVREVAEVSVQRLVELYAASGQIAFVALARYDGNLINAGTNPIVYATNP